MFAAVMGMRTNYDENPYLMKRKAMKNIVKHNCSIFLVYLCCGHHHKFQLIKPTETKLSHQRFMHFHETNDLFYVAHGPVALFLPYQWKNVNLSLKDMSVKEPNSIYLLSVLY